MSLRVLKSGAAVLAALTGAVHAAELTNADLEARDVASLDGVATSISGLTMTPSLNSANTPILYIRGQGLDEPSQITRDRAVGVYQDGFYIARSQALTFDLLDLDRVEVLRGPQGAAYGRNTSGGVINLISKAPAGELGYQQTAEVGNRNRFRVSASLDSPRWYGFSAKATILASSADGYVKNSLPGSHDYGEERQRAGRLQLRWDALATFRADYFVERSALDSTPPYDTNPYLNGQFLYFPFTYQVNPNGPDKTTYRPVVLPLSTSSHLAQGLTLTWQPASALTIRSLTGYRTLDAAERQDYAEFLGIAESTDDGYRHHQFSEELRLTGALFGKQLTFAGGLSYFKESGSHDSVFAFPTQQRSIERVLLARTRSQAAYLQVQWQPDFLHQQLALTAAARVTGDVKDAERVQTDSALGVEENGAATGTVNHVSYRRFNPAFTLSYRWTPDISTYATAATGYKAGGALESAPVGEFADSVFRPESLKSLEVGLQMGFWDERARVSIAGFSSRYEDIQYPLPIDAITEQVYTFQKATVRGFDLSMRATPLEDLTLSAQATALYWRMDRVDVQAGTVLDGSTGSGSPYSVGDNVRELFVLQYAPKYNLTVAGDYTVLRGYDSDLSLHLDYAYRAQMSSDPAAGIAVPGRQFDSFPAVGLLNARITYVQQVDFKHHIKVSLWGKNVLNRKYYQLAGGFGSGVSAFQTSAPGVPVGFVARAGAWAEPATYGVRVSYEY